MSRDDLMALTPEALASLSNLGLVKRAQRELAEGVVPHIAEDAEGTVTGTYPDGTVAQLPANTPLKAAPCSCGASAVCRHRIALALAYKTWQRPAGDVVPQPEAAPWSPGDIDDTTLESTIGKRTVDRARTLLRGGLIVTVESGAVPTAKLPSCTVKFLVPRDVAYARCDCALAGGGCEHLALAVWAFRQGAGNTATCVVTLGSLEPLSTHDDVLEDTLGLVSELLGTGTSTLGPSEARFALLRTRLQDAGLTWIHDLVMDLEIALEGYHHRSTLYTTSDIVRLLTELVTRIRAGTSSTCELPARYVLGCDEAPKTLLDHVRLVSLGTRLRADGNSRYASVYLADPDTASVYVLDKRWDYAADTQPENGEQLARRAVAPKISLQALSHGQLVSKAVTRLANRTVTLGSSRAAHTAVLPQTGDYAALPHPILVSDLERYAEQSKLLPPHPLRPRVLAENVHVIPVSDVVELSYDPAEQRLVAVLLDPSHHPFYATFRHRGVAPHAIDTAVTALRKTVRYVTGELRRGARGWELELLAIAGSELAVLDIAPPSHAPSPETGTPTAAADPLDAALTRAESFLEELCHVGLDHVGHGTLDRGRSLTDLLDSLGFTELARSFAELIGGLRGHDRAAAQWMQSSLLCALLREADWSAT